MPKTPVLVVACLLTLLSGEASARQAPSGSPQSGQLHPPGILLLAVDDVSQPWVTMIDDGFRQASAGRPERPALYFESLDAVRFENAEFAERHRNWLRFKYRDVPIDIVVTIGEDALRFLGREYGEPWPNARIVYFEVGGTSPGVLEHLQRASGVIFEDIFPASLDVIKRILPDTERLALVFGASEIEAGRFTGFANKIRNANVGLEPMVLAGLPMTDLVRRVGSLPPRTAVFLLAPAVDANGQVVSPSSPCELLSPAANGPTFTMGRQDIGCGVVGGLVRDWTVVGRVLADEVFARMHRPDDGVVHISKNRFTSLVFDGHQLERWDIPESRLPDGSVVVNRRPSLWRDYRYQTISVLAFSALQTALIVGLVFERRRRRRAEVESRRHLVTMSHLDRRAAMGQLTASLAHELNQPLGAILRNAEAAKMLLEGDRPELEEVKEIVEDIRRDDKRAAAVIRRLRALLQKHDLEMESLDVNEVARETVAVAGSDASARNVELETDLCEPAGLVNGDRVHLQQALLNIVLNGLDAVAAMPPETRKLTIRTVCVDRSVEVAVADTGPGIAVDIADHIFEPFFSTKSDGAGMGIGLSITKTIIEAHGGRLTAGNNAAGGATVRFSLPQRVERTHDEPAGIGVH